MKKPPTLPRPLRAALAHQGPEALAAVENALPTLLRPCIWVDARRTRPLPLARSWLGSTLGLKAAEPSLSLLRSKWGGTPYQEGVAIPSEWRFVGQINFAELPEWLPDFPRQGLLTLYLDVTILHPAFHLQWYPRPDKTRSVEVPFLPCHGRFEAALDFHPGWSVPPGDVLLPLLPEDAEVWEAWDAWTPGGFSEDRHHRLGGHGLDPDALTSFQPPRGRTDDLSQYESLLRLTFDRAADFSWGSNWIYLLIHPEDLRAGHLEQTGVALGNA